MKNKAGHKKHLLSCLVFCLNFIISSPSFAILDKLISVISLFSYGSKPFLIVPYESLVFNDFAIELESEILEDLDLFLSLGIRRGLSYIEPRFSKNYLLTLDDFDVLKDGLRVGMIYQKNISVKARIAQEGEKIITIVGDNGIRETENIAKENDIIITNPGGEEYIVDARTFYSRNTPIFGEDERLIGGKAKGYIKVIDNPFNIFITIPVPWGTQSGDKNCKIAATYDIVTEELGEPYIIEYQAFINTYKFVDSGL